MRAEVRKMTVEVLMKGTNKENRLYGYIGYRLSSNTRRCVKEI